MVHLFNISSAHRDKQLYFKYDLQTTFSKREFHSIVCYTIESTLTLGLLGLLTIDSANQQFYHPSHLQSQHSSCFERLCRFDHLLHECICCFNQHFFSIFVEHVSVLVCVHYGIIIQITAYLHNWILNFVLFISVYKVIFIHPNKLCL